MAKKFKSELISIIIICLFVFSCSNQKMIEDNDANYFKVYLPDYDYFQKFEILTLKNNSDKLYFLLVEKRNKNDLPPFSRFEKLKAGNIYEMKLNLIDTIVILKSRDIINSVYLDSILIWHNDSIMVPLHSSPNIFGRYIEILK